VPAAGIERAPRPQVADHREHHLAGIRDAIASLAYPVQYAVQAPVQAFAAMRAELERRGLAGAMEGALVQEMVSGGVETYVGMTGSGGFGALIAFGIGVVENEGS